MSVSVREQLTRKKPIAKTDPGGHQGGHAGPELGRNLGTFALMMFGVGATVGTGIFFVLPESVPDAGPAVVVAFLLAGLAAGLSADLLRRDGQRDPGERVDVLLRLPLARRAGGDGDRGLRAPRVRRRGRRRGRRLERLLQRAARQDHRLQPAGRAVLLADPRRGRHDRPGEPAGHRAGLPVHPAADPRGQRVGQGQHDHGARSSSACWCCSWSSASRRSRPTGSTTSGSPARPASRPPPARSSSPSSVSMPSRRRARRSRTPNARCRGRSWARWSSW